MADYQVGNLQIVFDTLNQTDEGFKKLSANLRSVQKAINNISNINITPFVSNIEKMREAFTPLLTDINGASGAIKDFNEVTQRLGINKVSQVTQAFNKATEEAQKTADAVGNIVGGRVVGGADLLNKTVNEVTQSFNNLNTVSTPLWERNKTAVDKLSLSINNLKSRLSNLNVEERNTQSELNKTDKATKKGTNSFSKLFQSIKRIAVYRILRTILKEISQAFTETVKAFAGVDDGINNTMSQLTSSLSIIKLSFGATLLPLLQMITPIIEQIGVALANVANLISQAMSTTGKYTAINVKAFKDYREQLENAGSLLDFDKFRVLQKQQGNLTDFLLPEQAVDEADERVVKLRQIFGQLKEMITTVFDVVQKIGAPILKVLGVAFETIIPIIKGVIDTIGNFIIKLDEAGLLEPIIYGIATALAAWGGIKVISSITKLISSLDGLTAGFGLLGIAALGAFAIMANWENMTTAQKIVSVIGVLITAVIGLALAFGAFHSTWSLGFAAAGIVAGIAMIAGAIGSVDKSGTASSYGTSGTSGFRGRGSTTSSGYTSATLTRVPSAGSEFSSAYTPAPTTDGGTAQQMETAMYNALVQYNSDNSSSQTPIVVEIDGDKVFTATRRSAQSRGYDFGKV